MWVVGADDCRAGWLVVFRSLDGQEHKARIFEPETLGEIFRVPEQPVVAAIDIPIGLLTVSKPGGRTADIACRKLLGRGRGSSVFPPPSRAALVATSFLEACEIERVNSAPPKKIPQQTFNILAKIREIDAIASHFKGTIFECHPEISFWAMNGRVPMRLPKKSGKSLNGTKSGSEERRQLLLKNGYSEAFLSTRLGSSKEYSSDDLLDACAAAWTAERIFLNQAVRFPLEAEFDELGLDMAIQA